MKLLKNIAFLSSIVFISSLTVLSTTANAKIYRYGGDNRYETATKISSSSWNTSQNVILVTGENFPDALAAAPLAKKLNAPILLTEKNKLNIYTSVEIKRLSAKNIYIVGGPGAISLNVEEGLKNSKLRVERIYGNNRAETSLKIAQKLGGNFKSVAIVNENSPKDAISIAPIAAANNFPILLTSSNDASNETLKFLSGKKLSSAVLVGDESLVPSKFDNICENVNRIDGYDEFARNANIISYFSTVLNMENVFLASSSAYHDALTGGVLAANSFSPIVLVNDSLSYYSKDVFSSNIIDDFTVLGGEAVVSKSLSEYVDTLKLTIPKIDNQSIDIYQSDKYELPKTIIVTASNGKKFEKAVKWNSTTVDTSKSGFFIFNGNVSGYKGSFSLSLLIKPIPNKINDLNFQVSKNQSFALPPVVNAIMTDGSELPVQVKWDTPVVTPTQTGSYVFYGEVERYNKKVKLTLTVR